MSHYQFSVYTLGKSERERETKGEDDSKQQTVTIVAQSTHVCMSASIDLITFFLRWLKESSTRQKHLTEYSSVVFNVCVHNYR